MAGGLLNLVSQGQQNIILNGNPSKTFFKAKYSKYTNFGLQKFRVDFEGAKTLRLTEESSFTFKIPRYADLLMDCYVSVDIPNIWSPILPPQNIAGDTICDPATNITNTNWAPYEFRWIENLGAQMISKVSITCGNQTLQEFSGAYLLAQVERDFNGTKRFLFDQMSGNTAELNDPANYGSRANAYPNAFYTENPLGAEPSIRGRTLYIPLNAWFNLRSQMAFPLVALQYNELHITITFRPINELFRIRDVFDQFNGYPYVAPNLNLYYMQMYRFLQPPPDVALGPTSYLDQRSIWNADIHLNCTYCFLSNDEAKLFALNEQKYLFKQVHETPYYNLSGATKIQLDSIGMVSSHMFFLRRSDANLRNEWSNYTNWPYNYLPNDLVQAPTTGSYEVNVNLPTNGTMLVSLGGPGVNPNGKMTGWLITGDYSEQNQKAILISLAILFDGQYRENTQPAGIYNYIEKYMRTDGTAPFGLYVYNYCLNSSPFELQPSGAINMSRFNTIEFELVTINPPLDPLAQTMTICDPVTGNIIGINKPTWRIYDYTFDLYLFEDRINMITFVGGNCGLQYAT
jgi:hypothetical protein